MNFKLEWPSWFKVLTIYSDKSNLLWEVIHVFPFACWSQTYLPMGLPLPIEKLRDGLGGWGKTWSRGAVLNKRGLVWVRLKLVKWTQSDASHLFMSNPLELAALFSRIYRSPVLMIWQSLQLHIWRNPYWGPLSHCSWPMDLTWSPAVSSHQAWTRPLLDSFLENPFTLSFSVGSWFQSLQNCLRLLPVYLEFILCFLEVHKLLEITDPFEKLVSVVMDT